MVTWNWAGSRRKRSGPVRRYARGSKGTPPMSRVVVHTAAVLNKEDIVGVEIKPQGDAGRYKMKKAMVICTLKMNPGDLVNFLVVKSSSPLQNWSALFSSPGLLVKENCQDMVTIVGKGSIEATGYAGSECTKAFRRFIRLGSGITQTQHLYVIIFSSASMKAVLEYRMYIEV